MNVDLDTYIAGMNFYKRYTADVIEDTFNILTDAGITSPVAIETIDRLILAMNTEYGC